MIVDIVRPCNRNKFIKKLLMSVKDKIGSVYFKSRSSGKVKRMAFKLHVKNPKYAKKPKKPKSKNFMERKSRDAEKNLLTVFSTNSLRYDKDGRLCGRGDYRSIPLEGVFRVKVNGIIHKIEVANY